VIEFYGGYEVYSESGIDLTLLRENLKLTVTERWERNAAAAEFIQGFRGAVRVAQCRNSPPPDDAAG